MRTEQALGSVLFLLTMPMGILAQSPSQGLAEVEPAGAGLPLYRPQESVAVLALAGDVWRAVPTDPADLLGAYQFLPPYATDDTEGQLFRLLEAEEGGTVADANGFFVAVPWTVGCGCAEEGWDQPDWVPPGDTVVFLLSATRKRVPWDGPPVFDVLGWHQPYPSGDFIPYWRWGREGPEEWLSVTEFFHLLEVLPTEVAFRLDREVSLRAVESWMEANPGREDAFPIPSILRKLEQALGPRTGEVGR